MKTLSGSVLLSTLAVVVLGGCDSAAKTTTRPKSDSANNSAPAQPELSPQEQYVADARQLVDRLIEIVETVDDPASAAKALQECTSLKPKAEELGETARKMLEGVRDDPTARTKLVKYCQSKCHSDAELKPMVSRLGESARESRYPELWTTVVELLETSMHNHF